MYPSWREKVGRFGEVSLEGYMGRGREDCGPGAGRVLGSGGQGQSSDVRERGHY